MAPLVLSFAPLQPSNLQITSGPDSPASPLSPFGLRPRPLSASDSVTGSSTLSTWKSPSSDAPPRPDPWTWKCHQCHSRFPLAVTRRCLIDGHYLCSGTKEISRRSGRVKHTKPCSSEFDYGGWRVYSKWCRQVNRHKKRTGSAGFDHCVFPSECRWSPASRAKRLREEQEAPEAEPESEEIKLSPTFESILGLPVYGEQQEVLEHSATFTIRCSHPNPLSSAPNGALSLGTSKAEDAKSDVNSIMLDAQPDEPESTFGTSKPASDRRSSARLSLRSLERSFERRSAIQASLLSPIEEVDSVVNGSIGRPTFQFPTFFSKFLSSDESHVKLDASNAGKEMDVDDESFDEPLHAAADTGKRSGISCQHAEDITSNPIGEDMELDEASGNAIFDFNLQQDDDSEISPRRNAWDWTPDNGKDKDTGVAISSPLDMECTGRSFEEMDIDCS